MRRIDHKILIVTAITIALSGCQTTDDTQDSPVRVSIAGVVLGTVTGALTNAGVGTAVSVATGLAAFGINNYQSKQVRSTAEERRVYGGATGAITQPQVKIQKSRNTPIVVKAGWKVAIRTVYWLNLPPGQSIAPVVESWTIKGEGISPVTLGPTSGARKGGKRETTLDFVVPEGVKPGSYVIEHKVQTGSSSDASASGFIVKS